MIVGGGCSFKAATSFFCPLNCNCNNTILCMELDKIYQYLKNPKDYQQGVYLLSISTKNGLLWQSLARKENPYNKEKLIYELRKLLKGYKPSLIENKQQKPTEIDKLINNIALSAEIKKDWPISLLTAKKEQTVLFKELAASLAKIDLLPKPQRFEMAGIVLHKYRRIKEIYRAINLFISTGEIAMSIQEIKPSEVQNKLNVRNNLRTYISKYEKSVLNPELTEDLKAKYQKKIENWKTQLNRIEAILC